MLDSVHQFGFGDAEQKTGKQVFPLQIGAISVKLPQPCHFRLGPMWLLQITSPLGVLKRHAMRSFHCNRESQDLCGRILADDFSSTGGRRLFGTSQQQNALRCGFVKLPNSNPSVFLVFTVSALSGLLIAGHIRVTSTRNFSECYASLCQSHRAGGIRPQP